MKDVTVFALLVCERLAQSYSSCVCLSTSLAQRLKAEETVCLENCLIYMLYLVFLNRQIYKKDIVALQQQNMDELVRSLLANKKKFCYS